MIYLDNNATTTMPPEVQREMLYWCNMGNPSAGYATAKQSRGMMESFKKYIGSLCGINTCCAEPRDVDDALDIDRVSPTDYKIIFTSCASESNCTLINGIVRSYAKHKSPHIVTSSIEHKSILKHLESLEKDKIITVTYVNPVISGHILPEDIGRAIKPNTCLVICMEANNETGAINNVAEIGRIAHSKGVPFHCDTVQTFGKFPIQPIACNVDSFCVSFHKLGGPPGVGCLAIKQKLLLGYEFPSMIFGSQNEGFRGGTENLPGIGASYRALQIAMTDRNKKNYNCWKLKTDLMNGLSEFINTMSYIQYYEAGQANAHNTQNTPNTQHTTNCIVFISGIGKDYLHNTILLSLVKRTGKPVCNVDMKNHLEQNGIIVSVGSACNTSSKKASHILYAVDADEFIRKGALRISLGDNNTSCDVKKFLQVFKTIVFEQLGRK